MSISINTATLHSKYDPWKEAEKYLRHSAVSADSSVYLLIEPGRGYLTHLLHTRNPNARLIEIHCSPEIEPLHSSEVSGIESWNPRSEQSLSAFLAEQIEDLDIGTVSILEWPPAERVFGSTFNIIKNTVRGFLQERRGTIHTTGKFGRLWLRNTLKRVADMPPLLNKFRVHSPIVIAASGPTLNRAIPVLQRYHRELFILALPSSIPALQAAGIAPDMIVHSDPGFYAGYHLRTVDSEHTLAAAPLHSAGYRHSDLRYTLLSTSTPIEKFFAHELGLDPIRIDSHGTVAGIAFQLAFHLGIRENRADPLEGPPIIFAGLDFSYDDIIGHSRPHSFDKILSAVHTRLQPLQHIYYARSPRSEGEGQYQSFALERYSGWFQQLSPNYRRRVYRLFPSAVEIPGFIDIGAEEFARCLGENRDNAGCAAGAGNTYSADLHRVSKVKSRTAIIRYSKLLHTQYEAFMAEAASGGSCSGEALRTLKGFPLLLEFFQYTDYSLLFRLRRESAGVGALRSSFLQNIHALDSFIQAVQLL